MMRNLVILVRVLVAVLILRIGPDSQGEDSWVKDSRRGWVKHGNPPSVPDKVIIQQSAINEALKLYREKELSGMQFDSQCLGTITTHVGDNYIINKNVMLFSNYAVDIVHVPRSIEDNLAENQCGAYRDGSVTNFIELDAGGKVVRVVD